MRAKRKDTPRIVQTQSAQPTQHMLKQAYTLLHAYQQTGTVSREHLADNIAAHATLASGQANAQAYNQHTGEHLTTIDYEKLAASYQTRIIETRQQCGD